MRIWRVQTLSKEKDTQLYKKSPALANELADMDNKLNSDYSRDSRFNKQYIDLMLV